MSCKKALTICLLSGNTNTWIFRDDFRRMKIASWREDMDLTSLMAVSCPGVHAYGAPWVQIRWSVRINSLEKILAVSSANQANTAKGAMPWKIIRLSTSAIFMGRNVTRSSLVSVVKAVKEKRMKAATSMIPIPILQARPYHVREGRERKRIDSSGFRLNLFSMMEKKPFLIFGSVVQIGSMMLYFQEWKKLNCQGFNNYNPPNLSKRPGWWS